ncbi:MAG: hypothetical protein RLZZ53_3042 [Acidobacteriota bacterium]
MASRSPASGLPRARLLTDDGRELAVVDIADTAATRARGLLGRTGLAQGCALWLAPCRSIHTIGMRFPIDVVYLDHDNYVVSIKERVASFRLTWGGWRSRGVLEFAAGEVARLKISEGQRLRFRPEG